MFFMCFFHLFSLNWASTKWKTWVEPWGTLYKITNMGRALGGPSTKSQPWLKNGPFGAQVVEAVNKQQGYILGPRSIFHIFLDPRLSVAPWLMSCCLRCFWWFVLVFMVFPCVFMFFPSVFLELSLYKMESMGRTLGDPLQNPNHGSKMVLLGPNWLKQ